MYTEISQSVLGGTSIGGGSPTTTRRVMTCPPKFSIDPQIKNRGEMGNSSRLMHESLARSYCRGSEAAGIAGRTGFRRMSSCSKVGCSTFNTVSDGW